MTELTQQKFKTIAKDLHTLITNNPEPTLAQMQQYLSQSMFHKTFEEAKATILTGQIIVNVYLCNGEFYIFNKERFVKKIDPINPEDLLKILKKERIKADGINVFVIPLFQDEELFDSDSDFNEVNGEIQPTVSYVKKMAKKMGGFSENDIFYDWETCDYFLISLYGKNGEHFVSEIHSKEQLCGDWFANVEMEGGDALCAIVEESEVDEYFSFDNLSNAVYSDGEWTIDNGNGGAVIRFVSK